MVTMTSPTVPTVPVRRVWTRHERDALPDDGNRYELIDGVLIVSPAPQWRHQRASMRLSVVLIGAVPAELEVLAAPFDVTLSDDTVMEPDLLVAPVAALAQRGLDGAPLLAVEIASPSSRRDHSASRCRCCWLAVTAARTSDTTNCEFPVSASTPRTTPATSSGSASAISR